MKKIIIIIICLEQMKKKSTNLSLAIKWAFFAFCVRSFFLLSLSLHLPRKKREEKIWRRIIIWIRNKKVKTKEKCILCQFMNIFAFMMDFCGKQYTFIVLNKVIKWWKIVSILWWPQIMLIINNTMFLVLIWYFKNHSFFPSPQRNA